MASASAGPHLHAPVNSDGDAASYGDAPQMAGQAAPRAREDESPALLLPREGGVQRIKYVEEQRVLSTIHKKKVFHALLYFRSISRKPH